MKSKWIRLAVSGLLLPSFTYADVSYQETTKITGGSLQGMLKMAGIFSSQAKQAGAATTSKIALQGNRMVRSDQHTTVIIDLDQHTVTSINHDKQAYSVMTFEQMRQAMAKAAEKSSSSKQSSAGANNGQMTFEAHVSSNGKSRTVDGRDAKEALLTVTMVVHAGDGSNAKGGMAATSELWLVNDVPGLAEIRSFSQRLMEEMKTDLSAGPESGLLAAQPGGAQVLADLKKESGKMSGLPVLQVTRVGISADGQPLPAPSVAPVAHTETDTSSAGSIPREVASDTATQVAGDQVAKLGSFGRALGGAGLGAFRRHKPSSSSQDAAGTNSAGTAPASPSGDDAAAGVLLESQTETEHFSTSPVDAMVFQIPAGYKLVSAPLK